MATSRPFFIFISVKLVTGYHCVIPYILFYIHGPVILKCFELCEITQIQNGRKWPF